MFGEGDGFDLCGEVAEELGVGGVGRFTQQVGAVAFGVGSAGFGDFKKAVDGLEHFAGSGEGVGVVAETAAHVAHFAAEYHAGVADEGDVVAEFFDALHVVGGEDDGVAGVAEFEDFALEEVGVEGVEAREGFVENEQGRAVHHGGDELHFLLHAFGEFFETLVPPIGDFEFLEPGLQAAFGFAGGEAFELREVDGLFADFHFLVESAFLGEVADACHIVLREGVSVEGDGAAVGGRDVVDDADEGGFAGAVVTEQAEDVAALHVDAHIVEGGVGGKALADVRGGENEVVHAVSLMKKSATRRDVPAADGGESISNQGSDSPSM